MRSPTDATKARRVLEEIGRRSRGPGSVYVTGGLTALLVGWRRSTVDVDLKLDPEPAGAFEAIAQIKNDLDVNIELSSPDLFVPAPADWRERSASIRRYGQVDFFHYDFRVQALAKLARGYRRDLDDVRAMLERNLISAQDIQHTFHEIEAQLVRYPALDAEAFRARIQKFLGAE